MVEHDPQSFALATIGGGDKALAGGVDLSGFGPAALEPFGKARAIGREIHPAMDHEFELREKIGEPRAALGVAARQLVEKQ